MDAIGAVVYFIPHCTQNPRKLLPWVQASGGGGGGGGGGQGCSHDSILFIQPSPHLLIIDFLVLPASISYWPNFISFISEILQLNHCGWNRDLLFPIWYLNVYVITSYCCNPQTSPELVNSKWLHLRGTEKCNGQECVKPCYWRSTI